MSQTGAYKAEIDVSTSGAVQSLKTLRTEIRNTTEAFEALNKVTASGEKNFSTMVKGVSAVMAEQRRAATVQKEMAAAQIGQAKATAINSRAQNEAAESQSRVQLNTARANTAAAQTARIQNLQGLENLRTMSATTNEAIRTGIAQDRLTMAQDRQAAATARAAQNQLELRDRLSNTRYLLYDVGATYRAMALGLEAIPAATAAVAIAYQRDFAQVLRVTQDGTIATGELRDSLKEMSTEIPVSFGELSQIATLGAQVGVSDTGSLEQLTETVAKFSAAVDGVPAETATLAFGRMQESFKNVASDASHLPGYFNKLGSAMAKVGATTAATDSEIVNMLNQIGPLGAEVGMTTAQVVGLAGALASVRVQPELARGTLTRTFAMLNRMADEGAEGMAAYARQLGISGEEAVKLWKENPAKFWQDLMQRLNEVVKSGGSLTGILDDLGVKASRDVSAITKLAVGYDVLAKSNQNALQAFEEGTALDEMAGPVFETVAAKLQIFANALSSLADSLAKGGLAPLGMLLEGLINVVRWLDGVAKAVPAVTWLINALMGLAAVTGVFLGFKAVQAFVLAGLVSFQQLLGSNAAAAGTLSGIIKQFAVTMLMAKGATEQQANAILRNVGALRALGVAMSTTNAQIRSGQAGSLVMVNTMSTGATTAARFGGALASVGRAALNLVGGLPGLITILGVGLVGALISVEQKANDAGKAIAEGLAQGVEEGVRAIQTEVKKFNVMGVFGELTGQGTVADVATRIGVPIEKVVMAIDKGQKGLAEFRAEIEKMAKERGTPLAARGAGMPGTWEGDAQALLSAMVTLEDRARKNEATAKALSASEKALGIDVKATTEAFDDGVPPIDKMQEALEKLNDTVFAGINAQANLGEQLERLGEGLQESGSFGNDEAGRQNLKNMQDTLSAAREYYKMLMDTEQLSAADAGAGYADFVQQLIGQVQALGGDLGPIEQLALQTVAVFKNVIGANATGAAAPMIEVQANTNPAEAQVLTAGQTLATWIHSTDIDYQIGAGTDQAYEKVNALTHDLADITGWPWNLVFDALTDPAHEKAAELQDIITQIVSGTYVATVQADVSAAYTDVQNFAHYTQVELASIQAQLAAINTAKSRAATAANAGIGLGDGSTTDPSTAVPQNTTVTRRIPAPPKPVSGDAAKANANLASMLNNTRQGYDKAAAAADKAGDSGKKAGNKAADAWRDAGDGIDEATAAANNYASRLRTALTTAFDKQYGVQKATDEYYSTLNAINKKREDELEQVDELREKIKQLNNERNELLIEANKAQIEARISTKYGETDRAADYRQQAQTALDSAAAKQKDIEASQKQANEIQDGIGKLEGYTQAAIDNRAALRDLESKMLDMIVAYANTGASVDQVRAYAAGLNSQFQRDVIQAGFNQVAVQALTGDLNRYTGAINAVPYYKPTTIEADVGTETTGALGAVNAFKEAMDEATAPREAVVWVRGGIIDTGRFTSDKQPIYAVTDPYTGRRTGVELFNRGGLIPGTPPNDPRADNLLASVDGKGMVQVRSGEFIQPQEAVDFYGRDFMERIRTMSLPKFAAGGGVGGGAARAGGGVPTLVELTAEQLAAVVTAVGREVRLYVDSKELAASVNRGNRQLAAEGRS